MRLNKRVEKLERTIGTSGECRACGGQGRRRIAVTVNGVDLVPLESAGCPSCGKEHIWRRLIIDGAEAEGLRVLCALARGAAPVA